MSISVQSVETNTGLYKMYIIYDIKAGNLYKNVERNVRVHLNLKFHVSSY